MQNGNHYTHLLTVATAIFMAHNYRQEAFIKPGSLKTSYIFNIREFSCAIKLGFQTRSSLPFNFKEKTFTKAEIGFMQL